MLGSMTGEMLGGLAELMRQIRVRPCLVIGCKRVWGLRKSKSRSTLRPP